MLPGLQKKEDFSIWLLNTALYIHQAMNRERDNTLKQVIREATRFSEGLAEDVYRCKSCGYTEKKNRTIDRIHRGGGGPIIMGGGGGFGGFSGGGGGGSWGGGSSGGGGSISRF